MLCVSVEAKSDVPKYKIISNSYQQTDIQDMYCLLYTSDAADEL